jgi:hypothetical protein
MAILHMELGSLNGRCIDDKTEYKLPLPLRKNRCKPRKDQDSLCGLLPPA